MAGRSLFQIIDGKCTEVWRDSAKQASSAFVHGDTFKYPLRHPKTGEMVDSMSRWNSINKQHGLECVGNDLLSKYPREIPDKITESRIMDAIEKAEAIHSDPARRNEYRYKAERLLDERRKLGFER